MFKQSLQVFFFIFFYNTHINPLSSVRKDILEETVLLGKSVERVIRLGLGANVAADGVGGVLASNGAARLVNIGNVDLN